MNLLVKSKYMVEFRFYIIYFMKLVAEGSVVIGSCWYWDRNGYICMTEKFEFGYQRVLVLHQQFELEIAKCVFWSEEVWWYRKSYDLSKNNSQMRAGCFLVR